MDEIVRIHASSGTTGKPTVVGYTRRDIETWAEIMARSFRAAGGRASDKVQIAYRLRPVHGRARLALRRGKSGLRRSFRSAVASPSGRSS